MPNEVSLINEAPTFEVVRGMVHIRYGSGVIHAMRPHDLMVGIERAKVAIADWKAGAAKVVQHPSACPVIHVDGGAC